MGSKRQEAASGAQLTCLLAATKRSLLNREAFNELAVEQHLQSVHQSGSWPAHKVVPFSGSRVSSQPNALVQVLHDRLPAGVDVKGGPPAVRHLHGRVRVGVAGKQSGRMHAAHEQARMQDKAAAELALQTEQELLQVRPKLHGWAAWRPGCSNTESHPTFGPQAQGSPMPCTQARG